jgi:thymidylate synthase (FAD)
MELTEPKVWLIAQTKINWHGLAAYLEDVGARNYLSRLYTQVNEPDAETLTEVGGKVCYRSWEPGLNPNVTKVRDDRVQYLENILKSGHGSVLEHASFTFAIRHASRIVTHELARHRAGTAISQESMRYVRLGDIPMWVPDWARDDKHVMEKVEEFLESAEQLQDWFSEWFRLNDARVPFKEKKRVTSFMRRFAPSGHATDVIWTANIRALRHIIELRTDPAAEEEIRLVFGKIADIMLDQCSALFGDFKVTADGAWVPQNHKV